MTTGAFIKEKINQDIALKSPNNNTQDENFFRSMNETLRIAFKNKKFTTRAKTTTTKAKVIAAKAKATTTKAKVTTVKPKVTTGKPKVTTKTSTLITNPTKGIK